MQGRTERNLSCIFCYGPFPLSLSAGFTPRQMSCVKGQIHIACCSVCVCVCVCVCGWVGGCHFLPAFFVHVCLPCLMQAAGAFSPATPCAAAWSWLGAALLRGGRHGLPSPGKRVFLLHAHHGLLYDELHLRAQAVSAGCPATLWKAGTDEECKMYSKCAGKEGK